MRLALVALACAACSSTGGRGRNPFDLGSARDFAMSTTTFDLAGADLATPLSPDVSVIWAHTADTLYTVDPNTFDLTTVGSFGTTDEMTDLAVTPDGQVYTISRTSLYKVDPQTAKATLLLDSITTSNVALTFQTDGTLLASDKNGAVRVIDVSSGPTSGQVTEIGSYGSGFDTAGDLVAVADGTMFGISESGPGSSATSNVLITVDKSNGHATEVGPIGFVGVFGIAYANGSVLAFTDQGQIISIDHTTGKGTLVRTHPGVAFYGAGTSPLVPIGMRLQRRGHAAI